MAALESIQQMLQAKAIVNEQNLPQNMPQNCGPYGINKGTDKSYLHQFFSISRRVLPFIYTRYFLSLIFMGFIC